MHRKTVQALTLKHTCCSFCKSSCDCVDEDFPSQMSFMNINEKKVIDVNQKQKLR